MCVFCATALTDVPQPSPPFSLVSLDPGFLRRQLQVLLGKTRSSIHRDFNVMKTLVIYHADCLDGYGAAWAAWRRFGNRARYLPAHHGDSFPRFETGETIYILDFAFPPEQLRTAAQSAGRIVVLDHHETSRREYQVAQQIQAFPEHVEVHFSQEQSGCTLTWRYLHPDQDIPALLRHIEDRDIWRFQLPGTREITTALYQRLPLPWEEFSALDIEELKKTGAVQAAQLDRMVQRLAKDHHPIRLGDVWGLAANAPSFLSSEVGHELAQKSGTFGATYHYSGQKRAWVFSLRSTGELDVGQLATQYGGGGHRNAAGFRIDSAGFMKLNLG